MLSNLKVLQTSQSHYLSITLILFNWHRWNQQFNFRFPSHPPLTKYAGFQNSNDIILCQNVGCDHEAESQCVCTQVIDINHLPRGNIVELVIANRRTQQRDRFGCKHPMHLHGRMLLVWAMESIMKLVHI